ncbi:sigma-70 family RNA polymerase sigma factor [Vagococcus fluvialis]|uniref:sigma-70 family RNA polymerase sigma factor n=1 Tax=Vagococcus fluvialis TaxID=2738 RepID=UPI003B5BD492
MEINYEDKLITKHHVLILGALKKCHITNFHPMFEDYLQIARWVLIDTHRQFIREGKSLESFHNYVYQRIYWKITDEIRKDKNLYDESTTEDEIDISELEHMLADTTLEDTVEIKVLLSQLQKVLTPQEKIYLEESFLNDLTISEIASKHKVSKRSVYNWRDKVAIKYLLFLK